MSKLFNHKTGKWEILDEPSIDAAVRSGQHTFHKGVEIPVVSPTGTLGTIPSEEAYKAFNDGYRWQTLADKQAWEAGSLEAIKQKNFDDKSGAAAAMGALDTATFGASSLAVRGLEESGALGTGLTEAAKEIKDRNTGAYIAGSLAGAVLPGAAAGLARAGSSAAGLAVRAATGVDMAGMAAVQAAKTPAMAAAETLVSLPAQASKLGEAAGKFATSALAPASTTAKIASKVAGGLVEGTAYGIGAGISEASLGRPEDVVDTLISNASFGALTGGALGGLIGVAPVAGSYLKDLGGRALSGVRTAVEEAARKGLRSAAVASAKSKGASDELITVLRDTFNDDNLVKTAMNLHAEGKIDEFNKFVTQTEKELRRTAERSAKDLDKSLNAALTASKGEAKEYIKNTVKESGQDIYKALDSIESDLKVTYAAFDDALAKSDPYVGKARVDTEALAKMLEAHAPTVTSGRGDLRKAIKQLREPGLSASDETSVFSRIRKALPPHTDPAVNQARAEILSVVDNAAVRGTPPALISKWDKHITNLVNSKDSELMSLGGDLAAKMNVLKNAGTEAESFAALRSLKQSTTEMVVNREGGDAIRKLNTELVDHLRNHPNKALAGQLLSADTYYSAFKILQKELTNASGIKSGKLSRLFNDPTFGKRVRPALDRFSEFVPEIEKVVQASKSVKTKNAALSNLTREMNSRMKLTDAGKLSTSDMQHLFNIIGVTGDVSSKIGKLEATTKLLQETAEMTVPDRLVALAKAVGDDASVKRVQEMMPHSTLMEKISQLKSLGKRDTGVTSSDIVAHVMASATAGPVGNLAVGGVKTMANVARSPWTAYETFKAIQAYANAGEKALAAVGRVVNDGIFKGSAAVAKKALPATIMAQSVSDGSRPDKLKKFKEIKARISDASSPDMIAGTVAGNLGHISAIPNIKSAISTRMAMSAQYLQAHLPADPTEQYSMVKASDWEPSDQELNSYMRRVAAVDNPLKAMAKVADGTITQEEVDAVKNVHPNIFAALQENILSGIIEAKGDVPYKSKLIISSVFGIPVDYSMSPEFIASMQGTYTPEDQGGRPETAETRKKNLNVNPLSAITDTSRISYGRNSK